MREIAMAGEENNRQRAAALQQSLLQRQAIHAAHAQIEQQTTAPVGARLPDRLQRWQKARVR
jgi:hypothetical protein